MKTMRRIDQPLQFDQPSALENSLLEIQQHYQQMVQHIDHFDKTFVKRRQVVDLFLPLERVAQRAIFNFTRYMVDGDFEDSSGTESSSESESEYDGDFEDNSGTGSSSDSESEYDGDFEDNSGRESSSSHSESEYDGDFENSSGTGSSSDSESQ